MQGSPLVTIAIPIYNASAYISDAINSVLNQTYSNFELLLINDGSTDNSMDIVNSFNDDRIVVIDDFVNRGLIYRLNQSISLSKGKYYARMDADDIMYFSRIDKQVAYLESHPEVDVLGCSIMTINDHNVIIGSGLYDGNVENFAHPTVIGKTYWFRQNQYAEWATRAEDTELWLRTSHRSFFWALPEPLLFYREFGVPKTKKYISSQLTLLKIFLHYHKYKRSFLWFFKNSCITIIKIALYSIFGFINKTDLLVKLRSRKPLSDENKLSESDLHKSIKKHYDA